MLVYGGAAFLLQVRWALTSQLAALRAVGARQEHIRVAPHAWVKWHVWQVMAVQAAAAPESAVNVGRGGAEEEEEAHQQGLKKRRRAGSSVDSGEGGLPGGALPTA